MNNNYRETQKIYRKELLILYNTLKTLDKDFRDYDVIFGLRKLYEDLLQFNFDNEIIEDLKQEFFRHYEKNNKYIFDWLRNFIHWDRNVKDMYFREFKNKEKKLTKEEIEKRKEAKRKLKEEIEKNKPTPFILNF